MQLDDGVFEVTLIKYPKSAVELTQTMNSLVNRDIDTGTTYCFRTSSIRLESDEEISWTLDGENGGSHKDVYIQNRHQAVEIRVAK